jgi:hypothetical protein
MTTNENIENKELPSSATSAHARDLLPPWRLHGNGFIFPLWAHRAYNLEHGFIQRELRDAYRGGFGAWMLVRYADSAAGPYDELLYMPGTFRYRGRSYKRITKIYVSSERAMHGGIRNWGIPKELASFSFVEEARTVRAEVSVGDHTFFRAEIRQRFFPFPIASVSMPPYMLHPVLEPVNEPDLGLVTERGDHLRIPVLAWGRGWGRFASLAAVESDEAFFPDVLQGGSLRFGLACLPFRLQFPIPKRVV